MTLLALVVVGALAFDQAPAAPLGPCADAATSAAATSLCLGEQALATFAATPKDDPDRAKHLRTAADHYRRAVTIAAAADIKARALDRLAVTFDKEHLNEPAQEELVLRELIALEPTSLRPLFRLANLQEEQSLIDAAESTLLSARHAHPEEIEPVQELTRFYARRATAMQQAKLKEKGQGQTNLPALQPDENGVYRIGGVIAPPRKVRDAPPVYPLEAASARLPGVVLAEITVDPTGKVSDVHILRSVPMLDEATLTAVKQWRYTPTIVDGKAVPIKMTVTVNFTQK